jgi:hypothetical protein
MAESCETRWSACSAGRDIIGAGAGEECPDMTGVPSCEPGGDVMAEMACSIVSIVRSAGGLKSSGGAGGAGGAETGEVGGEGEVKMGEGAVCERIVRAVERTRTRVGVCAIGSVLSHVPCAGV